VNDYQRSLLFAAPCVLSLVLWSATADAQNPGPNQRPGAALVERYVAAFNAHDADAFRDVIADNYVQHNGRAGQGLLGTQATFRGYFQTFPDMHVQIEDLIMDGDKVVARLTVTATHGRPVQLGPNAPIFQPTGKKLSWGDIEIWRVADGKFVEHWDQSDLAGLARQMRGD
jgi:predicted ester cyclase